jgi:hypothetical protein
VVSAFGDVQEMEREARGDALDQGHSYVPHYAIDMSRCSVVVWFTAGNGKSVLW